MRLSYFCAGLLPAFLLFAEAAPAMVTETQVFQEAVPLSPAKPGAPPASARLNVQSWQLGGPRGAVHQLPLTGFYIAHLLSGAASTTIEGRTVKQPPGAYWTVQPGQTMQIKVDGEAAVIETITVSR